MGGNAIVHQFQVVQGTFIPPSIFIECDGSRRCYIHFCYNETHTSQPQIHRTRNAPSARPLTKYTAIDKSFSRPHPANKTETRPKRCTL